MKDIQILILCITICGTHVTSQCPNDRHFHSESDLLLIHNDCNKFYKCMFGHPVEMLCPVGLYFNSLISRCDWKQNVDCKRNLSGDDQTQSENTEPENEFDDERQENNSVSKEDKMKLDDSNSLFDETEGSDIKFLGNGCPRNSSIHWLLPHENDCNLFYYCVWGEKLRRKCPSSLHFNINLQACDWPDNAGCTNSSDNDSESGTDNSQEDKNSYEEGDSQDFSSQEDSQEGGCSPEESYEDESMDKDTSEDPSKQKLIKNIVAIVDINLKTIKI